MFRKLFVVFVIVSGMSVFQGCNVVASDPSACFGSNKTTAGALDFVLASFGNSYCGD